MNIRNLLIIDNANVDNKDLITKRMAETEHLINMLYSHYNSEFAIECNFGSALQLPSSS
jgi:hypothetical protein